MSNNKKRTADETGLGLEVNDQTTIEHGTNKQPSSHQSSFTVDQLLEYTPTKEPVTVLKVHNDDPEEFYYTVRMQDGREKQTVPARLARVHDKPTEGQGKPLPSAVQSQQPQLKLAQPHCNPMPQKRAKSEFQQDMKVYDIQLHDMLSRGFFNANEPENTWLWEPSNKKSFITAIRSLGVKAVIHVGAGTTTADDLDGIPVMRSDITGDIAVSNWKPNCMVQLDATKKEAMSEALEKMTNLFGIQKSQILLLSCFPDDPDDVPWILKALQVAKQLGVGHVAINTLLYSRECKKYSRYREFDNNRGDYSVFFKGDGFLNDLERSQWTRETTDIHNGCTIPDTFKTRNGMYRRLENPKGWKPGVNNVLIQTPHQMKMIEDSFCKIIEKMTAVNKQYGQNFGVSEYLHRFYLRLASTVLHHSTEYTCIAHLQDLGLNDEYTCIAHLQDLGLNDRSA